MLDLSKMNLPKAEKTLIELEISGVELTDRNKNLVNIEKLKGRLA